jgi:hypothetical protein
MYPMDAPRAAAYTSMIRLLTELGTSIDPADQATIRDVADTRLFARELAPAAER